ncbi:MULTISPECIES: hypothetical protein [unclassified Ensifer]|uniref:hypothetical protein n=1 Tax=unclassified Ensifer TaxID=2633371 RepID=UPI00070B4994|nr:MULTISPECIES: hypothetical protein [unclassified Ensifer]KQW43178.1 hypothetical protein ASD02_35450 [Ensifer sp. Root1252]KRC67116.1 hypothetical protein ASE32_35680 [Ensifer sp. Root231]KRC93695.1 hypothetical protein ASE47_35535 [Ensifer sp. Root258]
MSKATSLSPFYRHYALVALAASLAFAIGAAVYQRYFGSLPNSIGTGACIGLLFAVGGVSAERFIRVSGRAPNLAEKRRLATVGSFLSILMSLVSGLIMVAFHYVMAFLIAHPVYQLSYYVMRQQLVAMWMDLGTGLLLLIFGGAALFSWLLGYGILRWTYGRSARKFALKK